MTSKPTPSSRLKKVAKEVASHKEVLKTLLELDQATGHTGDRATAILGGTFVEHILEVAILARLMPLDDEERAALFDGSRGGALGTFAAKIRIGHAMGIYGPTTRDDLDRVRDIRNAFAHGMLAIGFETKEVADLCEELQLIRGRTILEVSSTRTPKDKYISTVVFFWSRLRGKIRLPGLLHSPAARRSDWGELS